MNEQPNHTIYSRVHLRLNSKKLIQKVSQRNLLLFSMLFNILKVPFLLTIRKGSFSRWRPIWLPRAKFSISKAIFNIHKTFWCQTEGFNSILNILKVPFILTIRKESF